MIKLNKMRRVNTRSRKVLHVFLLKFKICNLTKVKNHIKCNKFKEVHLDIAHKVE